MMQQNATKGIAHRHAWETQRFDTVTLVRVLSPDCVPNMLNNNKSRISATFHTQ